MREGRGGWKGEGVRLGGERWERIKGKMRRDQRGGKVG